MGSMRRSAACLAALTMLIAACTSSTSTTAPAPATPAPTPVVTPAATPAAVSPTIAVSAAPSVLKAPPAPTNFTVTHQPGSVACPSPDPNGGGMCEQTDLTWQSTAAPGTTFGIYVASTGEGGASCTDVQPEEIVAFTTAADATTAQFFGERATGGGETCYWITAVNTAGESAQVPAAGQ